MSRRLRVSRTLRLLRGHHGLPELLHLQLGSPLPLLLPLRHALEPRAVRLRLVKKRQVQPQVRRRDWLTGWLTNPKCPCHELKTSVSSWRFFSVENRVKKTFRHKQLCSQWYILRGLQWLVWRFFCGVKTNNIVELRNVSHPFVAVPSGKYGGVISRVTDSEESTSSTVQNMSSNLAHWTEKNPHRLQKKMSSNLAHWTARNPHRLQQQKMSSNLAHWTARNPHRL